MRFLHPDGRDVRGDMDDVAPYTFKHKLPDSRNVHDWVELRFRQTYRGFHVEVLHPDGTAAHGNTRLANLRAEYD